MNNKEKRQQAIEFKKQGVRRKDIAKALEVNVRTITVWTKHITRKLKSTEEKLQARREWYYKNRKKSIAYVKKREAKLKVWWREYKSVLQCEKCAESHPSTLDFHHKDPSKKEVAISIAICYGWGKERILKEIAKCIVLCANCHRKLHYTPS